MYFQRALAYTHQTKKCPIFIVLCALVALSLSSCGGNSSTNATSSTGTGTPTGANSSTAYTIGGTVSNLSGTGLLLDNGGFSDPITSNGTFTFANRVPAGGTYNVLVTTQPSSPIQNCDVTNGNGTANANVTNIEVTCSSTYLVGGSVFGLVGSGLVLQDNGGDNLSISANGNYTFATPVPIGAAFNVTVLAQPSNPSQYCSVSSGNGTSNVDVLSVEVACTSAYTVGGMVSGLTGTGLVLQDNGVDKLPISSNGPFTFAMPVGLDSSYNVVVSSPPNNPAQNCTITNGSGQVLGAVTNVQVICSNASPTNSWEWVDGTTATDQAGIYGTLGVPAATNLPGGRDSGMTWTDSKGNLWLFGGYGYDSTQTFGALNDLWEYSAGQWTWVGGSNLANQPGVYGTQGTPAPGNVPGARKGAVTWVDSSGDFWLFGGLSLSYQGSEYNDLWKYSAGEWTWVSGANVPEEAGVYGTLGTASPTNVPGSRVSAVGWIDSTGALWIFGGDGYDSTDSFGRLNDLWKFSSGQWTWMGGSDLINQPGVYGTQGVASSANIPGARRLAVGWVDQTGNFWLFGGEGFTTPAFGELNDLWKYSSGQWTWIGGADQTNQQGTYGTLGTASPTNFPGARDSAVGLVDASGNFWLFAGEGYDSSGDYSQLNDLWKYSAGQWIWENGDNLGNQYPVYGTQGVSAPANTPGAVTSAMGWADAGGNLWIFGGGGYASQNSGDLNDLWKDAP